MSGLATFPQNRARVSIHGLLFRRTTSGFRTGADGRWNIPNQRWNVPDGGWNIAADGWELRNPAKNPLWQKMIRNSPKRVCRHRGWRIKSHRSPSCFPPTGRKNEGVAKTFATHSTMTDCGFFKLSFLVGKEHDLVDKVVNRGNPVIRRVESKVQRSYV